MLKDDSANAEADKENGENDPAEVKNSTSFQHVAEQQNWRYSGEPFHVMGNSTGLMDAPLWASVAPVLGRES